jgi:subtilisin family serine protease
MNAFSSLCLSALLLLFVSDVALADSPDRGTSPATVQGQKSIEIVPNLVIIKLRPQVQFTVSGGRLGVPSLDALFARIGATDVESFSSIPETAFQKAARREFHHDRMVKVRYTSGDHPELLAKEIANDPQVEYAEPYYIYPLHHTPNDPRLSAQWAVTVMKLKEAWDITTGDSTIVIGDIDTGVDWSHEDLAPSIYINPGEWGINGELANNGIDDDNNGKIDDWRGWDYYGNGSFQSPRPDNDPMDGTLRTRHEHLGLRRCPGEQWQGHRREQLSRENPGDQGLDRPDRRCRRVRRNSLRRPDGCTHHQLQLGRNRALVPRRCRT